MITENNRKMSVFAYYFSKFDKDAVKAMGYASFSEANRDLTEKFANTNQKNFIRLRRDEFDPLTESKRKGFLRTPTNIVLSLHNGLKNYSFEQFTEIVRDLILDITKEEVLTIQPNEKSIITQFTEIEIESVINAKDDSAIVKRMLKEVNQRVFDQTISNKLKKLYECRCQICGASAIDSYCVDVSEAHHLDYFSKSFNNNANNLAILCPDHHRIVHKAKATFNTELKQFEYYNGKIDCLQYNIHL